MPKNTSYNIFHPKRSISKLYPITNDIRQYNQIEGPLVHVLFIEMKSLLVTLMKCFLKADVVNGKNAMELQTLVVTDEANQLPLKEIDIGSEVTNQLSCY